MNLRPLKPAFNAILAVLWASLLASVSSDAAAACPPPDYSRARLLELKQQEFVIDHAAQRSQLALALIDCLDAVDPVLRDQIAFEALSTWMRAKLLTPDLVRQLHSTLLAQLNAPQPDVAGFRKPFAALVLSEIARMNRVDPFMTSDERRELVRAAAAYMPSITDYRGFDEREGWRHGVAHAADLFLQLALNPQTDKQQLTTLLDAIATQVTARGAHFYIYGESERLANAVFYIASRKLHTREEWSAWLTQVADPAPLTQWSDAFASQAGLSRRHNVAAFLQVLMVNASTGGDAQINDVLRQPLVEALRRIG